MSDPALRTAVFMTLCIGLPLVSTVCLVAMVINATNDKLSRAWKVVTVSISCAIWLAAGSAGLGIIRYVQLQRTLHWLPGTDIGLAIGAWAVVGILAVWIVLEKRGITNFID